MGIALYHQPNAEPLTLADLTIADQINIGDGTDTHIIKAVSETGLGGRLTLALDETARTLVICDYGDVDVDLGLAAASYPTVYLFDADKDSYLALGWSGDDTPQLSTGGSASAIASNCNWNFTDTTITQAQTFTATTGGEEIYKITAVDSSTQTAGMNRVFVVDDTVSGAKSGSADSEGISCDMTLSGNTYQTYAIAAWMTDSGNKNHNSVEGINVYLEDMGSGTLGTVVGIDVGINSTHVATGRHCAYRARNHSGTAKAVLIGESAFDYGIDFSGSTGGAAATFTTADIALSSGGKIDCNSGDLDNIKSATFISEVANTASGAFTIDWGAGQKQKVTITGTNLDITFTNPDGPANLTLKVIQGDGNDTIDWANEADLLWPGGTDPTLSTGSGEIDVVSFYFDGSKYYGVANLDFS